MGRGTNYGLAMMILVFVKNPNLGASGMGIGYEEHFCRKVVKSAFLVALLDVRHHRNAVQMLKEDNNLSCTDIPLRGHRIMCQYWASI